MHAPDVLRVMLDAGAWENDLRARLVKEATQPGDEDLVAVHVRRPVFEAVLRRALLAEPLCQLVTDCALSRIVIKRGSADLRVAGVEIAGELVPADIVVDASGRRSSVRRMLGESGVASPEAMIEDCGLVYYCRYFHLRNGVDYPPWSGVLGPAGTTDCTRFSVFFGDNRTFAIALGVAAWERPLKALAKRDLYMRAVARFRPLEPFAATEVAEPITDVLAMGALQNVFHPVLADGRAPVLGLHVVGDALCHTNPLFAWGLSLALDHGFALAAIIDRHPTDTQAQALEFAAGPVSEAEQCFAAVAEEDRDRSAMWRGEPLAGAWSGKTFAGFVRQCAGPAVMLDHEVARAVLRRANLLDLPDVLATDVRILRRVIGLQADLSTPPVGTFPTRDDLLDIVARG
jgi:2-polyprenyl-6-methoxyphenol hydroxylase-like FAD-dependent oxidoreductase